MMLSKPHVMFDVSLEFPLNYETVFKNLKIDSKDSFQMGVWRTKLEVLPVTSGDRQWRVLSSYDGDVFYASMQLWPFELSAVGNETIRRVKFFEMVKENDRRFASAANIMQVRANEHNMACAAQFAASIPGSKPARIIQGISDAIDLLKSRTISPFTAVGRVDTLLGFAR
jgi:hypothetical protein